MTACSASEATGNGFAASPVAGAVVVWLAALSALLVALRVWSARDQHLPHSAPPGWIDGQGDGCGTAFHASLPFFLLDVFGHPNTQGPVRAGLRVAELMAALALPLCLGAGLVGVGAAAIG